MVEFEIDLRGQLGILGNLGLFVRRLKEVAGKAAAEAQVLAIHEWINARRSFTPRTGQLQQSIGWKFDQGTGISSVYANMPYAGSVEYGTSRSRAYPYLNPSADSQRRINLLRQAALEAMYESLRGLF